ncbi:uncharacterized protein LOC113019486 isoform X3 [Astatotilapia calliptera]|nr:uncharacterized protein LOC113019486 isoform X3 [Astatotilapia calliptera]
MWNGQLSLYIVEATFAEIGTYECHVAQTGTNNSKAAILKTKPINTLNLTMEPMKVFAAPGEIAILPCEVPNKESIGAVMWTRSVLNLEKELFYQSNASDPSTQPPHYANRVRLMYTDMQKGKLTLFLYGTTFDDDGTYECHVTQYQYQKGLRLTRDWKRVIQLHFFSHLFLLWELLLSS